jgi:hypothetical protein
MLDFELFRSWPFSTVISAVLNYICVYTIIFMMPFICCRVETSPYTNWPDPDRHAGLMAIVAPLSGTISDRIRTACQPLLVWQVWRPGYSGFPA